MSVGQALTISGFSSNYNTCAQVRDALAERYKEVKTISHLKISIQIFFSLLQEVPVHVVEGFLSWKFEDRRQVLKLKQTFKGVYQ